MWEIIDSAAPSTSRELIQNLNVKLLCSKNLLHAFVSFSTQLFTLYLNNIIKITPDCQSYVTIPPNFFWWNTRLTAVFPLSSSINSCSECGICLKPQWFGISFTAVCTGEMFPRLSFSVVVGRSRHGIGGHEPNAIICNLNCEFGPTMSGTLPRGQLRLRDESPFCNN